MLKTLALFIALCLTTLTAQAHFVWVQALPASDAGQTRIQLSFAEEAGYGEKFLVEKNKQTKVTSISAGKSTSQDPLTLKLVKDEKHAWWEATIASKDVRGIQAVLDYGVITREGSTFWLNYYAKGLSAPLSEKDGSVQGDLQFEVVAKLVKNEIELQALWDNKPAKEASFVITYGDDEKEVTADEHGIVRADYDSTKAYSIRAARIEKSAGEHDGKKYELAKYYSTLTIPATATSQLAAHTTEAKKSSSIIVASTKKETIAKDKIPAPELLAKARSNRVVWDKFPGFSATTIISDNGVPAEAKISISAKSNVSIEMEDGPTKNWLQFYLNSMVDHRLPSSNDSEDVKYVTEDQTNHPLGVKIALNDEMESYYRIRDNIVYEVNRAMGKNHFTISVLDVTKNSEGKYLPAIFTFTVFNEKGKLISTLTENDRWVNVKGFELPEKVTQVSVEKDKAIVRVLEFKDHKLLDK